jgi:hypothetical protein
MTVAAFKSVCVSVCVYLCAHMCVCVVPVLFCSGVPVSNRQFWYVYSLRNVQDSLLS